MRAMVSELTGALIIQQLVQSNDKAVSKNRVTGRLPGSTKQTSYPTRMTWQANIA